MSLLLPLKNPKPDSTELMEIILRKNTNARIHPCELHIDAEIIKEVAERYLQLQWIEPSDSRESQEAFLLNYIEVWYRLGFDCIRLTSGARFSADLHFQGKTRDGKDTAELTRDTRKWTEEGAGVIKSWDDFECYPWPTGELDLWPFEFLSKNLPEGMGFWACISQGVFEIAMNTLLGFENMSLLLYDEPGLVQAVFDRCGQLILDNFSRMMGLEKLIGIFQGDDMGFKTQTLISPDLLKEYVLPWHKKFAGLAHDHGLIYGLHSCGHIESIMEALIHEVKIDAKHSFEDTIMPVADFKNKYGNDIAVIGGVDVDALCRLDEKKLRRYVRKILDDCSPGGGYLLGSGNSITNYVPVENYLIMLDEGVRYAS